MRREKELEKDRGVERRLDLRIIDRSQGDISILEDFGVDAHVHASPLSLCCIAEI